MQKSAKIALIAVFVVIIGGGGAFYAFVLRDTAPPKATDTFSLGPTGSVAAGVTADGTWKVKADVTENFAGYRIQEVFGGDTIKKTASGRTQKATGTFVVKGANIESAEFAVDMTTIASDRAPRDNLMKTAGLESEKFPTSMFKISAPLALGASPELGKQFDLKAKGDLTLHGVTKPVEFTLKAGWAGDTVKVSGSGTVTLADFGITQLQLGPATVEPTGEIEFQLTLAK